MKNRLNGAHAPPGSISTIASTSANIAIPPGGPGLHESEGAIYHIYTGSTTGISVAKFVT